MPKISDSEVSAESSEEEIDELDYGSDEIAADDLNEGSEEEVTEDVKSQDELLTSESEAEDEELYASRQSTDTRAASKVSKSSKTSKTVPFKKAKPKTKGKLIHFDAVNIPKGDDAGIDKFISTRVNADDSEDVLVKYKVLWFLTSRI